MYGTLLGFAIYAAHYEWRFGNLLTFGQPWAFSLWAVPRGMSGLLFSRGFGLLWYCPAVLVAVVESRPDCRQCFLDTLVIPASFLEYLLLCSYANLSGS